MKRKCRRGYSRKNSYVAIREPKKTVTKSIEQKKEIPKVALQPQEGMVIKLPNLADLEKAVNETVIGQENVVRSVCTKVYEGLCFPMLKRNILLVGKSGTGKTEIIRQLSENLNLPCTIEDATRYTEDGYVGASVSDMISNLLKEANGNMILASRGIIFIDEIDKKASRNDFYSGVNKEGVLKGLLKIVEGTVVQISNPNYTFDMEPEKMTMKFDTSNIIFIFGGAFEGLAQIKEKRLKKRTQMGFASADANHIVVNNYMNTSFTKEDLIEYGLPAELVGRISNIYETRELQIDDFYENDFINKEDVWNYENIEFVNNKFFLLRSKTTSKSALGIFKNGKIVALNHQGHNPYGITPKNVGQKFMLEALLDDEYPLVIIKGNAGTGKTFCALASGLEGHNQKKYSRILVTRSVTATEQYGYLPGDIDEKLSPYLAGIKDNLSILSQISGKSKGANQKDGSHFFSQGIVQIQAIGFLRGRSIVDSYFIIDETQNIEPDTIKSIVTRAGEGSKFIFLGDPTQIDNPNLNERYNGLVYLSEKNEGKFNVCSNFTFG